MAGILEKFFQIALLLTVMLLFMNIFLATFGYALTGDATYGESIYAPVGVDTDEFLSGDPTSASGSEVWQQDSPTTIPTTNKTDWNSVWNQFVRLVYGFQTLVENISSNINPATIGDPAEQVGAAVIMIVNIIQIVGAAYIPWALISAWTGGGSP